MMIRVLALLASLLFAVAAHSTVIWSDSGESGTCDTGVSSSVWDYTQSGDSPNSRFFYTCTNPVPGSIAGSKYYRVTTVNLQHDSWNIYETSTTNLSVGTTYYLGAFLRFDRINGVDIWHDGAGQPDSYDKLFEIYSNLRVIIASGFPDWATCSGTACNGKFTFGAYLAFETCTNCIYEQVAPNVSPYSSSNFILCDYGKWYAVVIGVTPSNGSTENGRLRLWINGTLTTDRNNIKTQDTTAPTFWRVMYSGTMAQPAYDAPAHYRSIDGMMFADSLTDVQNAGLMSDPEASSKLPGPSNPRWRPADWDVPEWVYFLHASAAWQ